MTKSILKKISLLMFPLLIWASEVTYASNRIQDSVYGRGSKALIADATLWLTGLLPASCGLFILYQSFRKKWSDGEGGVHSDADKKIKKALWVAVIGTTSSGLVALITGYFT